MKDKMAQLKEVYRQYNMTDLMMARKAVMGAVTRASNPRADKTTTTLKSLKARLALIDEVIAERR